MNCMGCGYDLNLVNQLEKENERLLAVLETIMNLDHTPHNIVSYIKNELGNNEVKELK